MKKYSEPMVDIIEIGADDIIQTSTPTIGDGGNQGSIGEGDITII